MVTVNIIQAVKLSKYILQYTLMLLTENQLPNVIYTGLPCIPTSYNIKVLPIKLINIPIIVSIPLPLLPIKRPNKPAEALPKKGEKTANKYIFIQYIKKEKRNQKSSLYYYYKG
nr:3',5'-cyclic-nucleotide phosphodiesterase [Oedogonium sp. 210]